jgi:hypothetical protein
MSESDSASRRPLEVKEGILLDRDGTPLLDPRGSRDETRRDSFGAGAFGPDSFGGAAPRVRVVRLGGAWLPFALLLLLPLFAAAGLTLLAVVAAVMVAVALLRAVFRAFRG